MLQDKWSIRGLVAFVLMISGTLSSQSHADTKTMESLKVSSLGRYEACKMPEGWRLNVLRMFQGKLFIGQGDTNLKTGPTDIVYYDLEQRKYVKEFTVDEHGIYRYRVLDGQLVIPGPNRMESREFGSIYIRTDQGWVKRRTVTKAVHVLDIASIGGTWFASIGSEVNFGEKDNFAFGAVLFSNDKGMTWHLLYTTQSVAQFVHRMDSLSVLEGKLYGFPYAFTVVPKAALPKEFQGFLHYPLPAALLGRPDLFGVLAWNPIGPAEAYTFDGREVAVEHIIPESNVCQVTSAVYGKMLVLAVLSGRFVEWNPVQEDGHLAGNAKMSVYAYDGKRAQKLNLGLEFVRAIVPKEDRLLLLGAQEGQYRIAETKDLQTWQYYSIPEEVKEPKCLESDGERFFIGTNEGYLFEATAAAAEETQRAGQPLLNRP